MNFVDALLGITGSISVTLVLAILMGGLVSNSRLQRAEAEAQTWRKAYETLKETYDAQAKVTERSILSAEIADKVMQGLHESLRAGREGAQQ